MLSRIISGRNCELTRKIAQAVPFSIPSRRAQRFVGDSYYTLPTLVKAIEKANFSLYQWFDMWICTYQGILQVILNLPRLPMKRRRRFLTGNLKKTLRLLRPHQTRSTSISRLSSKKPLNNPSS